MINSHSNQKIKLVKSLAKKKYRDLNNMFIVEGERFVNDAPQDKIVLTLVSKEFASKKDLQKLINVEVVEDKIFNDLIDTKNSQGILAVCKKDEYTIDDLKINDNTFIVIGDRLQDPGNVGTLIRTAEASGVDYIILSEGSVDIYNPKVIRSTASTIFNIPILENVDLSSVLPILKKDNVEIIGTHLKATEFYYDVNMTTKLAIVIGNEANGMCEDVTNKCTKLVKIPILGKAESLNASISSAIIMYEVVRQKKL